MSGIYDVYVDDNNKLFQKVLKNIIAKDIHSNSLGCAVHDTHIRVGNYHLTTFYQAEILFGNLFWTNILADWLCDKIVTDNSNNQDVVLIGYEAYIGFLLQTSKEKINQKFEQRHIKFQCLSVHTYEEKNYESTTNSHLDNRFHPEIEKGYLETKKVIFICGVGLTASTFGRMEDLAAEVSKTVQIDSLYYTLIQIFPNDSDVFFSEFISAYKNFALAKEEIEKLGCFLSKPNDIEVRFCVSVNSDWYLFENCPKCKPENEKILIETNGIPIIPMHQIDPDNSQDLIVKYKSKLRKRTVDVLNLDSISTLDPTKTIIDTVKKDLIDAEFDNKRFNGIFELKDTKLKKVLRYGHINLLGHHYQYFFKTDALAEELNDQLDHDINFFKKRVKTYCKDKPEFECNKDSENNGVYSINYYKNSFVEISDPFSGLPQLRKIIWMKRKLHSKIKNGDIIVIVAPNHYGNALFPLIVNKYLFDDKAQIIGFDSKKMFRSNFLLEYSNYSTFHLLANRNVHYYFVDDEIIDGKTYSRTKSLMQSLIQNADNSIPKEKFEFSGCITLINRQSEKAINSFEFRDEYFYFYNGYVPTLKIYDNSCPLCKESDAYHLDIAKTALSATADYCKREYVRHNWRILSSAEVDNAQKLERAVCRFQTEEDLYFKLLVKKQDIKEILEIEWANFTSDISRGKYNCNRIISVVKAITKPYLFFKENVRDEALSFSKMIFYYLINLDEISHNPILCNLNLVKELWHLLVSVLKALGRMGSNILLDPNVLVKAYNKLKEFFAYSEGLRTKEHLVSVYCTYLLVGNVKRVLTGVDGKNKSRYFSDVIYEKLSFCLLNNNDNDSDDLLYLFLSLYLESNTHVFDDIEKSEKKSASEKSDIVKCALSFRDWLCDQLSYLENNSLTPNNGFNNCIDCFVHSTVSEKNTNDAISPLFQYMLDDKMPNYIKRSEFDLSDRLKIPEAIYSTLDGLGICHEITSNNINDIAAGKGVYYWIKIDEASILDTVSSLVKKLEKAILNDDINRAKDIVDELVNFNYKPNFTLIDRRQFNSITLNMYNQLNNDKQLNEIKNDFNELIKIINNTTEREEKVVQDRNVKNVYIVVDVAKFIETKCNNKISHLEFLKYLQAMLSINYHEICHKYLNNKVIDKYTQSASFQKALTMSKASYHDVKKHIMERSAVLSLDNLKKFGMFRYPGESFKINDEFAAYNNNLLEMTKLLITDNYSILVNQFIVTLFRWISVNGETVEESDFTDCFFEALVNPIKFKEARVIDKDKEEKVQRFAELIYVYALDDAEPQEIKIYISLEGSLTSEKICFRKLDDDFLLATTFPGREILFSLILNTISHTLNNKTAHKDSMSVRIYNEDEMWCIACEQLSDTDLQADVKKAREYLAISPALRGKFFGDGITLWSLKKYFDCLNRKSEKDSEDDNFKITCNEAKNEFIVKMRCLIKEAN